MTDRYCTKCGTLLDPNGQFCGGCGRPVEAVATTAQPGAEVAPPVVSPPPVAAAPVVANTPPPSTGRSLTPIVAIVVVAAVAIGGFAFLSSRSGAGSPGASQGANVGTTSRPGSSAAAPSEDSPARPPNGLVDGPGFQVQIPTGYTVVRDGSDGSDFVAALDGNEMSGAFVIVSHQPFSGDLDAAAEHYENVMWEGRTVLDLGPANLSGVGADGRHMVLTGFPQGPMDAYLFVHGGQLWELRISTSDFERPGVAASFAFD